ncbi:annexin A11-like [Biomphalaria glabrata]|uniref:Annexin n=1 Tax=Biomphalaria glabrata TaxID=6526 RepID=A0A9W2YYZ0_BIOGL|nr:annexin A11-like [Biomphalaria glabrata]
MASNIPAPVWPSGMSSVHAANPFDPEKAAEALRKAMKGLGTDEGGIIKVLSTHCNAQRLEIDKKYKTMFGRDLRADLESEISGRFKDLALALLDHPRVFDAKECNDAIKGAGTDEEALIEILSSRSNAEIADIRAQYKALYKRELERDIQADTSGHFKRLLTSLVSGHRENDRTEPDVALAKKEAQELYQAGEKQMGTDESVFNKILCLRSIIQLRETFSQYKAISGKDIEKSIEGEMSGSLELGCLAIVKVAKNPAAFFAESLYKSMKGAGTKDKALIRAVVSRSEVDMQFIKQEFQSKYGKSLASFIEGDTSGDYKKLLVAIVGK